MSYTTTSLMFASFIGFAAYIMLAWQEWQKLTGTRHSLWQFITDDQAGFGAAVVFTLASYIALPELAKIDWFKTTLGFTPERTPLSAMAAAFVFSVLGYQIRAFVLSTSPLTAVLNKADATTHTQSSP